MGDPRASSVDDAHQAAPRSLVPSTIAWLRSFAEHLIPESGAPEYRNALLVGVLAVLIVVVRVPRAWSTVWAEDGNLWLSDAVRHGSIHTIGQFWQGYLTVGQRLAVMIPAALPLKWAAPALATTAAVTTGFCAFLIYLASGALLRHRAMRIIVAVSVALLPIHGAESIGNLACLQFILVPTCFWLFLWTPRSRVMRVVSVTFVAITALSSVLIAVLLPVALIRFFLPRARHAAAVAVVLLITLATQFIGILIVKPRRTINSTSGLFHGAGTYVKQVIDKNLVGGSPLRSWLPTSVSAVVSVVVVAAVVIVAIRPFMRAGTHESDPRLTLAAVAILSSGVIYLFTATLSGTTPRYGVLSSLLLVGGLAAISDALVEIPERAARTVVAVLAAVAALAAAWSLPASAFRRSGPTWSSQYAAAQRDCRADPAKSTVDIEISPTIGPDSWEMTLPCNRLALTAERG